MELRFDRLQAPTQDREGHSTAIISGLERPEQFATQPTQARSFRHRTSLEIAGKLHFVIVTTGPEFALLDPFHDISLPGRFR